MQKGEIIEVEIISLNSEGDGIGKLQDGYVIFVKNTLPGDKIRTKIQKKKRNYLIGSVIDIIEPSESRIKPTCKHFGICGGCKFQNLNYESQLKFKSQIVSDSFTKIGNFSNLNVNNILGSDNIYHYRNKMEFTFSDDVWIEENKISNLATINEELTSISDNNEKRKKMFGLGLHIPNFHSKIIDVKECYLQSEISYKIVNFVREFFKKRNKSIYTIKTHTGYLRFLIIRQSFNTKDIMVNLITNEYEKELINEFKDELLENFTDITTVVNSISTKKAQVALGEYSEIVFGNGYIIELLNNGVRNLKFRISPNSFFQTNTKQCEKLFKEGLNLLDINQNDSVLDLYCGAGAISIFISEYVKKVFGVELLEDAIKDAKTNAKLNNINNIDFIQSDIKDFLKSNENLEQNFNIIILDPPRSGLHPDICKILSETNFEKILYISCNPSTQARDIKIICSKGKYKILNLQPVDMFPNTIHVENICLLSSLN